MKTTTTSSPRPTFGPALTATAVTLVLAAGPASGQDALGRGRALDSNLSRDHGRYNGPAPTENFRSRNLIVTDNVIGGRGFRGVVDYGAEGAFAGVTGSDDQRRFRADAAWSSPNFANFSQTYQQVRFGQDIGLIEYASVGMDQSASALQRTLYRPNGLMDRQIQVDRSTIQAALGNVIDTSVEPAIVGGSRDEEGRTFLLQASSLGGLQRTPMEQAGQLLGLSTLDAAWVSQYAALTGDTEAAANIGRPYESDYSKFGIDGDTEYVPRGERLEPPDRVDPYQAPVRPIGQPVETDDDTAEAVNPESRYARIATGDSTLLSVQQEVAKRYMQLERIPGAPGTPDPDARAAPTPDGLERLDEEMQSLRRYLGGSRSRDAEPDDGGQRGRAGRLGLDGRWSREGEGGEDDESSDESADEEPALPRTIEEFGLLLRHGQRIDRLATPEDDRFNALMSQAEQSLRTGRYMRAERKFERALRLIPGHPLATGGLANTQLGAGLYVSAALTLRDLYTFQPEMIDARFEDGLVPVRPRLLDAVDVLNTRIETLQDRALSGFLLAYVGRLLGEQKDIETGLRVMEEDAPDDPLLPLLKSIWLESS